PCVSLFLVGALAFGVLISTIAESQQVAFQIALLTSFLPTLMLSGFIFPISSMPVFLQAVTHVLPARFFLVILRGILLKGVGVGQLWVDIVSLAAFSLVVLALASLRPNREWACRAAPPAESHPQGADRLGAGSAPVRDRDRRAARAAHAARVRRDD